MATTILEKQQRRKAILDELQTYAKAAKLSNRPFSEEERNKIELLKSENDSLKAELAKAEGDEKSLSFIGDLEKELAEVPGRATQPDALGRTDEQGRVVSFVEQTDEEVTLNFTDSNDALRRQSYALQKRADWARLKRAGYQPCGKGGQFKDFSDFVRLGFKGHQTLAFQEKLQKHYLAIPDGMSEAVGSDGGYLVMPEFAQGIIDRVYANDLWSRTDNYTVTGNNMTFNVNAETSRANGSRHGGLRGYWMDGEGSTITSSKPTFRQVSLRLMKLGVLVYLTQELIDDGGAALQQYVARKAAEEFNFLIGDSLINGTGVGQPLGILNAPSLVSIAKESGQAAATLVPENIEKMYARFFAPNISRMVWTHNQDIRPQLDLMTLTIGTGGAAVYLPPGGMADAPHGMLRGRPLLPTEFNATLGTQGDLIAADFGQILSISKGGIMQAASIHVEFLTDQLALRFIMRLNAQPWESAPITPYKGTANTQSNFVVLDTR